MTKITGLDIEQDALDRLKRRAEAAGLSERVKALKCSMFSMDFPGSHSRMLYGQGIISPDKSRTYVAGTGISPVQDATIAVKSASCSMAWWSPKRPIFTTKRLSSLSRTINRQEPLPSSRGRILFAVRPSLSESAEDIMSVET